MNPNEIRDDVMRLEMGEGGWDLRDHVIALCQIISAMQAKIDQLEKSKAEGKFNDR
jgi:hypothetical protein